MDVTLAENELLRILTYAKRFSPFYADRIDIDLDLAQDDLDSSFRSIPILTKTEVKLKWKALLSTGINPEGLKRLQTNGTTGEPLSILVDDQFVDKENSLLAEYVSLYLQSSDWQQFPMYYLQLHVGASSASMPAVWNPSQNVVKWNLVRLWQATDEVFFRYLSRIDDCVVTTMPSVAELVALRIIKAKWTQRFKPILIICSGESLTPRVRKLIKTAFGCPVTSLYTLTESGIAAFEETPGLYRPEFRSVYLEILDQNDKPSPLLVQGSIVITVLNNQVMPLIRYRTGDFGMWTEPGLFRITRGRKPQYLQTVNGGRVNTVRFVKMLAPLRLDKYSFDQTNPQSVIFTYYSSGNQLDQNGLSLVQAAVSGTLGPDVKVIFSKMDHPDWQLDPSQLKCIIDEECIATNEPLTPRQTEIVQWLQSELSEYKFITSAVITGSFINPSASTRYSDIDLVILASTLPDDNCRSEISRKLRAKVPALTVHIDRIYELRLRAPMLVCRLLAENEHIIGDSIHTLLAFPELNTIRSHGIFRSQEVLEILQHHQESINQHKSSPVRDAWINMKYLIDVFRYHFLLKGKNNTSLTSVIENLAGDDTLTQQELYLVEELHHYACEFVPPVVDQGQVMHWYNQTKEIIRRLQGLMIQDDRF